MNRPHSQFDAYLRLHRASAIEWRAALQRLQLAEQVFFGNLRQPPITVGSLSTLNHARGRITLVTPMAAHTLIKHRRNQTPLIVIPRAINAPEATLNQAASPPLNLPIQWIPAHTEFELDLHPGYDYWLLQSHQPSCCLLLTEQQQQTIRHHFQTFLQEHHFSKDHQHSEQLVQHLFDQIAASLYSPQSMPLTLTEKPLDNRIKKALHKLEHDREWSFDLAELASLAGVSERNLYYLMKNHIGMTPYVYYQRIRLLRVRQRLVDCQCDVPHVSWYAGHEGFSHLGRFAALFRKHFGELPSETIQWRRSLTQVDSSETEDVIPFHRIAPQPKSGAAC